jgi:flagellar hook assembly protein FlgD
VRHHSPDGYARTRARSNEAAGPIRRARRVALCLVALALVGVVAAWAAPRVSAAAAAWLATPSVRGSQVAVTVGSASGQQALGPGTRAVPLPAPAASGRLGPGWVFNAVGVVFVGSVPAGWQPPLQVRTSKNGTTWTAWQRAGFEPVSAAKNGVRRLGESMFWVGDARFLEYRLTGSTPKATLRFTFINTLGDATLGDRVAGALRRATAAVAHFDFGFGAEAQAAVPQPTIVTRAQWGADESWRTGTPDYASVRMAFVHHTVSGNDYTKEQAPALVRAIYYYHAKSEGFRDIGYNFLIDRYGTIYEGRYGGITRGPVGAQVLGFNTGTTGISIIGDFSNVAPPTQAIASLEYLLAWKLDVHHIDPASMVSMVCGVTDKFKAGQTVQLPAISGHRDANFTACPGDKLYAQLPTVRAVVADRGLPKIYGYLASTSVISPNGDGLGDSTTVTYAISEAADWTITVTAADGTMVRSFAGNGQFVTQAWDGLDANGKPVPDGTYTITGTATCSATSATPGATATPAVTTVVVDTTLPSFTGFVVRSQLVNPDGTGAGDRVGISYALSEAGTVQVIVKDAAGAQVRQIQGWTRVTAGAHSVSWDGKVSSNGKLVPAAEGQYTIEADGRDAAGNPCSVSGTVAVDRTVRVSSAQPLYFSPNGDRWQQTAKVTFVLRRAATVKVSVLRSAKSVASQSLGSLAVGTHTFVWKGRTAAGKLAAAGSYSVVFTSDSGQATVQAACSSVVDLGRPTITSGSRGLVKRRHPAVTHFRVRDARSAKVHVIAVVRTAAGKVLKTIDYGWLASGSTTRIAYTWTKQGRYTVWFGAIDQGGNRQAKRAIWRVQVKK